MKNYSGLKRNYNQHTNLTTSQEGTCVSQFLGDQEPDIRQPRTYGKVKFY